MSGPTPSLPPYVPGGGREDWMAPAREPFPAAPPPLPQRRSRRATAILAVVGILVLGALGWRVSAEARDAWWNGEAHVPVPVDANGVAELDGLQVELTGVERLDDGVSTYGDRWEPPDGLVLWQVGLAVQNTNTEILSLDVLVQDTEGRRFETGSEVPYGVDGVQDSLEVAPPEPGDDPLPDVQYLLVLMPQDAEPAAVRLESTWSLAPDYFRLPVTQ
ncbi:hypothetical protein EXU48_15935 [Occultella glacieicola]|uniref:DUF4352 domain-containing protein n=1 Tax=Occultella glacieicola TaxID=2518684 RepID=A0ABY2E0Z7_9MICO|nr:hypothetical protein [Occultella glacieicola]TDE91631.1 hypothetical protein EXU48_15935 [Occultella glacieicola]